VIRFSVVATCAFTLAAGSAFAQTNPYIQEHEPPKPQAATPSPPANGAPERAIVQTQNFQPFVLRSVNITGTSTAPEAVAASVKPFIGETLDQAGVKRVADALADAYGKASGFALFNVLVPTQDFKDGVLQLVVVEGHIESVDIEGDTETIGRVKGYTDQLLAEKPLTLATYERVILLIRQIAGLTPDIRVVPGNTQGGVRAIVTLKQKTFAAVASVNNRGTALLGRTQLTAQASLLSLFREGEQITGTYATPTSTGRFRYAGLNWSEPLDEDGTSAAISFGYLRTNPKRLVGKGEAGTLDFTVTHPLVLDFEHSWVVTGSFDMLNSTNALFGSEPANERVRALRAGSTYTFGTPTQSLQLNTVASFGLNAAAAHESNPLQGGPAFQKIGFRFTWIQLLADEWLLRFHSAGQYGFDRLPVSEMYPLGGTDFGRAYQASSISGDQAAAGSLEIAWRPALCSASCDLSFLSMSNAEVYGYADGGRTWTLSRGPSPGVTQDVGSLGTGVRATFFDKLSAEVEGGRQLVATPFGGPHPSWQVDFSVSLTGP
jgi:hemolysin activation/secretion protein